ncbi:MAG: peptidylprolyl isomerase [Bacteroidales bacterium]
MATLQKIRNRSGLVVTVLAIALFGFIVTDYFSRNNSQGAMSTVIAKVGDREIESREFSRMDKLNDRLSEGRQRTSEDVSQSRQMIMQQLINKALLDPSVEELNLGVSKEEMMELTNTENASPVFAQNNIFVNQQTRQFDEASYLNFITALNSPAPIGGGVQAMEEKERLSTIWQYLEHNIVFQRQVSKFNTVLNQGLYTTSAEGLAEANGQNTTLDFDVVSVPYSTLNDSVVSYSKSDLQEYYKKHINRYKSDENCQVTYLSFPVDPSDDDIQSTKAFLNDRKHAFGTTKNPIAFVNTNSDVKERSMVYSAETVDSELKDSLATAKQGDVYGPFVSDDRAWIARIDTIGMLPDSVRVSHILIDARSARNQMEIDSLYSFADSLKTLLDNGVNFAQLAKENSQDAGSASKGGDVGWVSRGSGMVQAFEDAAFNTSQGKYSLVPTQFGFHIVKNTDIKTKSRQAIISKVVRYLEPSSATKQKVYAQVSDVLAKIKTHDDINTVASELTMIPRSERVTRSSRSLTRVQDSKEIINAAFSTKEGIVSNSTGNSIFENNDLFTIAYVNRYAESGYSPLNHVESQIIPEVVKEKKAQLIVETLNKAMSSNTEFNAIADAVSGSAVESVTGTNFSAGRAGKLGNEPSLVGAASALAVGTASKPIIGNNGVYLVKVTDKRENKTPAELDIDAQRERLNSALRVSVSNSVISDLRNKYEVKDESYLFF